ncbi:MAG TPA: FkbM family methyltransferase [Pseudonocardiaceae bacterium]|jgi:FkbM family methyltransferase|nr:FkbM family methyltransferase [Pseudonocardiaceae bacterium]
MDTARRRWNRAALTVDVIELLARRTPYLEPELLGLADLVHPGDVCVDVGAAAGIYTLLLSHLVGDTGEVHCVEPLRFAHRLWSSVIGGKDGRNVRRHEVALGTEPGTLTMSVPVGRWGKVTGRSFLMANTTGLGSNAEFAGHVDHPVQVDTLDALCADLTRLDFVKVDVEGAELLVLTGGQHVIEKFRPALLLEIEARHIERYGHTPDAVVEWLAQRHYTMHIWNDGWQPADAVCAHARNYLFLADEQAQ